MHDLVCVGCGPGDPELLTVKAVKAIKEAEVIMCPTAKEGKPSIALSVVESIIEKSKNPEIVNLVFPMVKDKETLETTWENNTKILAQKVLEGKKVVYLTVGDPYLYSTWIYLNRELQAKFPQIKISVIPGIVSMFTFASKVGISLAEGAETMAVIPSCYDLSRVKETARNCDTMIFLKDGRYFDQVINLLKEAGFSDDSIFAIG
ncbi:MAG TPA: precorrin-2 C(20)-methyltransferase, partial [Candidatus Nitrosotenuis sp.]